MLSIKVLLGMFSVARMLPSQNNETAGDLSMRPSPTLIESDPDHSICGFLLKTFEIFSDGSNYDMCSWGPSGDTVIVKKVY